VILFTISDTNSDLRSQFTEEQKEPSRNFAIFVL